jgi:hypothetical protein
MCGWKSSVDDVLQRHGTPSQTEPASTPEAIQDQQSSGGPLEKYQCTGAGCACLFLGVPAPSKRLKVDFQFCFSPQCRLKFGCELVSLGCPLFHDFFGAPTSIDVEVLDELILRSNQPGKKFSRDQRFGVIRRRPQGHPIRRGVAGDRRSLIT